MSFVETGLTATKYLPQLLAAFDVLPDNGDSEHVTTESHQTLRQSVYSRHVMWLSQLTALYSVPLPRPAL